MRAVIPLEESPKICILGAPLNVGNMGCRALAVSLIGLIDKGFPGHEVCLMYGGRERGGRTVQVSANREIRVRVVNYRLSPKARLDQHLLWILLLAVIYRVVPSTRLREYICASNEWLRCFAHSLFVGDISGGDSFSDIYGRWNMLVTLVPSVIALLVGARLVLLPQTYGPFKSGIARFLARIILSRASTIYSRDSEGALVLQRLQRKCRKSAMIRLCPDVAFTLEPIWRGDVHIHPELPDNRDYTLVALNVSGLLDIGGYISKGNQKSRKLNQFGLKSDYRDMIHKLVVRLLQRDRTRIMLVPHEFAEGLQSDLRASKELLDLLDGEKKSRVHMIEGSLDQSSVKAVIGMCDFLIGSRMHACIAAMSQNIPCVGIAYSRKFLGVFESVGVGDMVLDARVLTSDEIVAGCIQRLDQGPLVAGRLRSVMPSVCSRISAALSFAELRDSAGLHALQQS